MQFRGVILAVVLAALSPLTGADRARAQEGEPGSGAAADAPEVREVEPQRTGPYVPRPGMEERVIVAGESESAGDFAAGDSITGFDASDLEALGALSVADIGKFTPNLEIVTTGATTPTFFIRGVGLNDFNSNAASAVSIYQDDVAINAPALQLGTLFDMENVNVLRGPRGTGPYRNASAGAIKLYSRRPSGDYGGYLRSSLGAYWLRDFEGAVEAPIFEDLLSMRVAFRAIEREGYRKNDCGQAELSPAFGVARPGGTGGSANDRRWSICGESVGPGDLSHVPPGLPSHVNNLNNWAGRAQVRFQPTLDMDWLLTGKISKRDELSPQGISYGTNDIQFYPNGTQIDGQLGAADGGGYLRPSVLDMSNRVQNFLRPLFVGQPGCTIATRACRPAQDVAEILVASEIAGNLDSDPFRGAYNRIGSTTNDTWGVALRGEVTLPQELTLRTVSGYDAYDREINSDTDQSPNVLFEIRTDDEGWQYFQDLGLTGVVFDESPVDWDVGAFYLMEELDVFIDNTFAIQQFAGVAERDYTQKTWGFGTYASLRWKFWDKFTLDGGVRYNWERKTIDYRLRSLDADVLDFQERTRSAPTGEVRLTYNFREDTHAYWKYTRGWKGGHFNATTNAKLGEGVTYAEPEENNAYEVGVRGAWFDSRIMTDFQLFYYDYSNYQLFTVQQSDTGSEFVVLNASDVEVLGAEADFSARPWNGAFVNVRFGWLESRFIDYVQNQKVDERIGTQRIVRDVELNFSGNRLLNSPQFKVSLTGEQTVPLGRYGSLTARYDAAWSDVSYFDASEGRGLPNAAGVRFLPENTIGQKPYWVHNALVIYRPPVGNVEIQGWVRNLTNEVYKTFAFDATQFQKTTIIFLGEPRMWGLTLLLHF